MKSVAQFLENISNIIEKLTVVIIQVGVVVLIIDLNIAVLFRYVLNSPIVGTSEIALYLLAWITFLGATLSIKDNSMVAVTFILEKLGKLYRPALIVIQVLITIFCLYLFYYGYGWVTSPSIMNTMSSSLQIPVWIPYSVVPISMLITIIFSLNNILKLILNKNIKIDTRINDSLEV